MISDLEKVNYAFLLDWIIVNLQTISHKSKMGIDITGLYCRELVLGHFNTKICFFSKYHLWAGIRFVINLIRLGWKVDNVSGSGQVARTRPDIRSRSEIETYRLEKILFLLVRSTFYEFSKPGLKKENSVVYFAVKSWRFLLQDEKLTGENICQFQGHVNTKIIS